MMFQDMETYSGTVGRFLRNGYGTTQDGYKVLNAGSLNPKPWALLV